MADVGRLLGQLRKLETVLQADAYHVLLVKFTNLFYVAQIWQALTEVFLHYTKYFELQDVRHESCLEETLERMLRLECEARDLLGDDFYVKKISANPRASYTTAKEPIQAFAADVRRSFAMEKELHARLTAQHLTDFVICGGGFEGHKIMKEVNFSDTYLREDGICRIPGTYRGKAFSTVNTHGWFSYEVRVKNAAANTLVVIAAGSDGHVDFDVTIGAEKHEVRTLSSGKAEYTFAFRADQQETVRVRFDRVTGYTPFIYEVKVL